MKQKKKILKLINAYCATTFTIMSTTLDSALSVPWSSSTTSIVSLSSDQQDPENSSCLFDLVNGLYLIDSHYPEVSCLLIYPLWLGVCLGTSRNTARIFADPFSQNSLKYRKKGEDRNLAWFKKSRKIL
jgi:hypothetical protein